MLMKEAKRPDVPILDDAGGVPLLVSALIDVRNANVATVRD